MRAKDSGKLQKVYQVATGFLGVDGDHPTYNTFTILAHDAIEAGEKSEARDLEKGEYVESITLIVTLDVE